MRRYKAKREYVWTGGIAYTVGLIASDGCLARDGRHIDLTSTDLEILANFSIALGRDFTIGTKLNQVGQPAYRIQFSDTAYYDFLLSVGLTPAKSKTMPGLLIPDEHYAGFLRGLFDGDGSCYSYYDPRWKASFMFYISFVSASQAFLNFVSATNTRLIGTSPGAIRSGTRVLLLTYAKKDSHLIYEYLYRDTSGLFLTRKKSKLEAFVENDKADILS